VGQFRSAKARLSFAVPILIALLNAHAALADDCACAKDSIAAGTQPTPAGSPPPAQSSAADAAPAVPLYASKETRPRAFAQKRGSSNLDLRFVGSDANSELNSDALKGGEISHKYVGVELGGNLESVVTTKLQLRFTEAQSDPAKALFDLQPVDQSGDARRALQDFSAASSFLGQRVTVTSYQRSSSFALVDVAGENAKGELAQHHLQAMLWRSDRADLDFDAGLSRTSAGYWDFGDSPDGDLHANNNRVSQYRSKLRFDRFGLSVLHRDASTLAAVNAGEIVPSRSETEAKVSLNVSDLREDLGLWRAYRQLLPLPDSIWVGANHGALISNDDFVVLHQAVNKISLGASRNIDFGTVNASYWQSATQPMGNTPAGYRAAGHGLDVGSSLNFGALGLNGSVGLVNQQTFSAGSETDMSTLNGAFFVSWQTPFGVDLKAGMTRNSVQNALVDYGRLEENNAFRYQLALDLSQLASTSWQNNIQLKVLASFQGNQNHLQPIVANGMGNMFTGVQFAIPIHP